MKPIIALIAIAFLVAHASAARAQEADEAISNAPYLPAEHAIEDHISRVMRRQMQRCWQMPIDQPNAERLAVTVQFSLNEDGSLRGDPRVVSPRNYTFDRPMRVAVERAIRAIRDCSPYPFATDPVTAEHYELWDEFEFIFRPMP